jgi:hypothetical protein
MKVCFDLQLLIVRSPAQAGAQSVYKKRGEASHIAPVWAPACAGERVSAGEVGIDHGC